MVLRFAWARNGLTRRPVQFLMSAKFILVAHGACGGDDDGRGSTMSPAGLFPIAALASTLHTGLCLLVVGLFIAGSVQ